MARGSFVWTDSEVELLLRVALDYKANKALDNVDWESCQTKYRDMLALFLEQYPSETSEEYPHVKQEITRAHLTTKMKAVRGKYRNAVDTGRRSGHGRVVLLYYELCEQVWGGSPATTTIQSGIETNELDSCVAPSPTPSTTSSSEVAELESEVEVDGSVAPTPTVKERRALLQVCRLFIVILLSSIYFWLYLKELVCVYVIHFKTSIYIYMKYFSIFLYKVCCES